MPFSELVDMVESPDEQRKLISGMALPMEDNKPRYPYGLSLNLNEDSLEKLGIETLPEVGSTIHLKALAKVTSVSKDATDEKESSRVCLQITHLAFEEEDEEEETEEAPPGRTKRALYGEEEE